jgi:hypothetical protein
MNGKLLINNMKKILIILTIPFLLNSCNLVEGLRQTNPKYESPTIFSDNWWEQRKTK